MNPPSSVLPSQMKLLPPLDVFTFCPRPWLCALIQIAAGLLYFGGALIAPWYSITEALALPVWPSAGIALALLLRKPQLWFGTFIGAIFASYHIDATLGYGSPPFVPLIGAAGAIASAFLASVLVHRLKAHHKFATLPSILLAVTIAVPMAAFISAIFGTLGAVFSIEASAANLADFALTWMLGDLIGGWIVVPLLQPLLWFVARRPFFEMLFALSLPVACAIGLGHLLFADVRRTNESQWIAQTQAKATTAAADFANTIAETYEVLEVLRQFVLIEQTPQPEAFRAFTLPMLRRHPEISALSWNPVISGDAVPAFVSTMQTMGFPDFSLKDRTPLGELIPAQQRAFHIVVGLIEPYNSNKPAHGLDVFLPLTHRDAFVLSARSGEPHVTDVFRLVQERDRDVACLIALPLLDNQSDLIATRGFVVAVLRLGTAMSRTFADWPAFHFALHSGDLRKESTPDVVYCLSQGALLDRLTVSEPVPVNGRNWVLHITPVRALNDFSIDWQAWSVLAALGFFCAVYASLVALLLHTKRRFRQALGSQLSAHRENLLLAGDFVSTLHQGVRAPLTRILSLGDLIGTEHLLPRQHDRLNALKHTARDLLTFVDDVMELQRSENGVLQRAYENIDPRAVISTIAEQFHSEQLSASKLRIHAAETVPQRVVCDRRRFQQLFHKLLRCAFDTAGESAVRIAINCNADEWSVCLSNNGRGLPNTQLQVLEPSSNGPINSTLLTPTLLNLRTCKKIAEQLDWKFAVESQLGRGMRLTLSLPMLSPSNTFPNSIQAADHATATQSPNPTAPVLLIDSNPIQRTLLKQILHSLGFECHTVPNSHAAAKSLAAGTRYAALLLNAKDSILSSYQIFDELMRASTAHSGERLPIIAIGAERQHHTPIGLHADLYVTDCASATEWSDVLASLGIQRSIES